MDPLDVVALARALIDIDSTTGREREASLWLADHLRSRGFAVAEQPVGEGRCNLVALAGERADVVLSTHLDCVPPFFPSRVEGTRLYGRGSADAKGILAAQVVAAERLRARGCGRVGLLFVVGEERGSDGAIAANTRPIGSRFLVNGEPTGNRLASGTRGVWRVRLRAAGRAAHSSRPELGLSAIDRLIDALVALRGIELPSSPALGRTFYTVGLISGGVAPNVVPPSAEAEVLFRTVGPAADVRRAIEPIAALVTVEEVLEVPPIETMTVAGFDTAAFAFTTDLALLGNWGRPLLYGPGCVEVAHSEAEHVEIPALERAVDDYVRLVDALLE